MFSTREKEFLAKVQAFADRDILPHAIDCALGKEPDKVLFQKAAGLGLTAIEVPRDQGGCGFGFRLKIKICQLLASYDFGFAMSLINTQNVAVRLARDAQKSIRERYLPPLLDGAWSACTALSEPHAGSDFAALTTRAMKVNSGWIIDGTKSWIVNGRRADLAILFAQCQTGKNMTSEEQSGGGASGIGSFIIDLNAPGVHRFALDSAFSQTTIGSGGFTLDQVSITDDHLLFPAGQAVKRILSEINQARLYVAAMCNGMLEAAIRQVKHYGTQRQTFGKPLSAHQAWRFTLADAITALSASQALTRCAVDQLEDKEDIQRIAAEAKINAVAACQQHLPTLLHAMGAEGLKPDYCFARHIAATQSAALTDGATNMLRERVFKLADFTNES